MEFNDLTKGLENVRKMELEDALNPTLYDKAECYILCKLPIVGDTFKAKRLKKILSDPRRKKALGISMMKPADTFDSWRRY